MSNAVRKHMAAIGRLGGLRSRRRLDSDAAREMVRIREARRAYRRFHATCFWWCDPAFEITAPDIPWLVEGLRKNGNREAWEVAARLCR